MKRAVLARIAMLLTLAMLLPSATLAIAEAPEPLDMEIVAVELELDGAGDELVLEDGSLPLDNELADLEGLLLSDALDIRLSEDALSGEMDEAGLAGEAEAAANAGGETLKRVRTSGGPDNDALFEAWILRTLPGLGHARSNRSALTGRAGLDGLSLKLYDALVPMIRAVAKGERTSTEFAVPDDAIGLTDSWWTAEQLGLDSLSAGNLGTALLKKEGFNQKKLMQALLADCPYELYWFDKVTGGMGWSFNKIIQDNKARLTGLTANMAVAVDYSRTGTVGTYEVNDLPARVSAAVTEINGIVSANAGKDDLAKLEAYARAICDLTGYNSDAAGNPNTPYGDPWQLVYVFDGVADTKVVCEGYAKAFKYLCDLSDFDGEMYCELMTGTIPGGNHMWNAVRMPDGRCYLADLTNSRDGSGAFNGRRFLKPCTGQAGGPYTCDGLTYTYNDNTRTTFSDEWLNMSGADYGKGYAVTASATHGTLAADPQTADAGDTVTLTLTPEAGYLAAAPTVRAGNRDVSLQQAGEGQWRFTMPWGDVTATVDCAPDVVIGDYTVSGYAGVYDGQSHGISVMASGMDVAYGTASGVYDLAQSPAWRDAGTYTVYYCIRSGSFVVTEGEASVAITPKAVGLSWSDTGFTYDGETHAPTAAATGLIPGDSCAVTVAGGGRDAGSYTAMATGLSNGNYALPGNATQAFTIAPRTVGLSWSQTGFTYDGETHAPTAAATGLIPGDSCAVTVAGGGRDAGSYTATATGLSNGNYALPGSTAQAFTIAPRTVGLSWSGIGFTYDGETHAPTAAATGLVPGDSCAVTVAGGGRDAGSYTATATGLSNGNYTLPEGASQAFTIAPRTVGLNWSDTGFTYDGETHVPTAAATGLVPGDSCAVTVTGGGRDAGSYTATATGLSNGNYTLPGNAAQAFTIAPRTVTLKWSKTKLTYNRKAQKPTAKAVGLVPGDTCTVTVKGARKNAGSYTATATALSNGNYALPEVRTRAFRIKKKTVGLKWTNTRLPYNGKRQKPTVTVTGLIAGDKCRVTVSGAQKKKGTYTARATKLSNRNYQLPTRVTVKFRIY